MPLQKAAKPSAADKKKQQMRAQFLKQAKAIAKERGGKCLSSEYITAKTKLEFQCAAGHVWQTTYDHLSRGSWCRACFEEAAPALLKEKNLLPAKERKVRLLRLQEIASSRGGECLSQEYLSSNDRYQFRCGAGHVWDAVPKTILDGGWCRRCFSLPKRRFLEEIQAIAEKNGGRCLSSEYGLDRKLSFVCAKGHQWQGLADSVKKGIWCGICATDAKKLTLEDMQQIAASRGGRCLSDKYVNNRTHLMWECSQGHVWRAMPQSVKLNGTWCAKCGKKERQEALEKKRASLKKAEQSATDIKKQQKRAQFLEEAKALAKARGGKCLSAEFISAKEKLEFRCAAGHIWQTAIGSVRHGSWCPQCFRETLPALLREKNKLPKEEKKAPLKISKLTEERKQALLMGLQDIASFHGGDCLSTEYLSSKHQYQFRCSAGHIWETTPQAILNGRWCRQCFNLSKRLSLEEMQAIAEKKGGRCLSAKYEPYKKLSFVCAKGHKWQALADNIKQGVWCAKCAVDATRLTLEEMQEIAASRGGRCLSDKYVNNRTHLIWECHKGHVWRSMPQTVKLNGSWCPQCSRKERLEGVEHKLKRGRRKYS